MTQSSSARGRHRLVLHQSEKAFLRVHGEGEQELEWNAGRTGEKGAEGSSAWGQQLEMWRTAEKDATGPGKRTLGAVDGENERGKVDDNTRENRCLSPLKIF